MKKLFMLLTLAVFALAGCATTGGLDLSETAGPPGAPPVGPNTDLTVKSLSVGGADALTMVLEAHDFANATERDAYFDGTPNAAVDG